MHIIDASKPTDLCTKSMVTVGNFDGIHRGHTALINHLIQHSRDSGASSLVVTFEPHTRKVLFPDQPILLLTTLTEKCILLEQAGVDICAVLPFSAEYVKMEPADFVEKILIGNLKACGWVMGEDHAFGSGRHGDKNFLQNRLGKNHFSILPSNLEQSDSVVVSSTEVRLAVAEHRILDAVRLLGHPYLIVADRVSGIRKGTELGYPTFNFVMPGTTKVMPPDGIYAARLNYKNHELTGALYIGSCPTFTGRENHLEFHALEFDGTEIESGCEAQLYVYEYIRADKAFSSGSELSEQIQKDIHTIRTFFYTRS